MICEKCGKEIESLLISVFNRDGSDSEVEVRFEEADFDAVVLETNPNWTGYELSEEEMRDDIRCPCCKNFPFKNEEIQLYSVVRIVCFKSEGHGQWIKAYDDLGIDRGWKCSRCNGSVYEMTHEPYTYCPHCGAKMDLEDLLWMNGEIV